MSPPHTICHKPSAVALEAEKQNRMPKLDSAVMGCCFFELVNNCGATQVLHLFLLLETSETILLSGVELSLERVGVVPS